MNNAAVSDPDKECITNVFDARGLRWKRLRAITSPTFSATKLKAMEPILQDSIQALMRQFGKSDEKPIDVYEFVKLINAFTLT